MSSIPSKSRAVPVRVQSVDQTELIDHLTECKNNSKIELLELLSNT